MRVVRIRVPGRRVAFVGLITPSTPTVANAAGKHFEERARAASFDDSVLLIWLSGVLALAGRQ